MCSFKVYFFSLFVFIFLLQATKKMTIFELCPRLPSSSLEIITNLLFSCSNFSKNKSSKFRAISHRFFLSVREPAIQPEIFQKAGVFEKTVKMAIVLCHYCSK